MGMLHIAPSDTAGGSLRMAILDAGRGDQILSWLDNLSCGPIASDDPAERAKWWAQFDDDRNIAAELQAFWDRVAATNDRLVVWFGRHSASELAFFLAWTDRLGDRPYDIVEVTERRFPVKRQDGSRPMSSPVGAVGVMNPEMLKSLLGSQKPATSQQLEESRQAWRRLKADNAPFRVVTATGLVSAPMDYFDPSLLERATPEWKRVARVIGETMVYTDEPYMQVGDLMLRTRVSVLVNEGKLLADGDPGDMLTCQVRLPS
jgi:hypothetical protein